MQQFYVNNHISYKKKSLCVDQGYDITYLKGLFMRYKWTNGVRRRESNKECWVKRRGELEIIQDSCYTASSRSVSRMCFHKKSQKSRFGEFLKFLKFLKFRVFNKF